MKKKDIELWSCIVASLLAFVSFIVMFIRHVMIFLKESTF